MTLWVIVIKDFKKEYFVAGPFSDKKIAQRIRRDLKKWYPKGAFKLLENWSKLKAYKEEQQRIIINCIE